MLLAEQETIKVLYKICKVYKDEAIEFLMQEEDEKVMRKLQGIIIGLNNYWAIVKDIRSEIGEVL